MEFPKLPKLKARAVRCGRKRTKVAHMRSWLQARLIRAQTALRPLAVAASLLCRRTCRPWSRSMRCLRTALF
jgi:hypothetical protein